VDSLADNNIRLTDISCGEQHMLARDDTGNVWTWGEGEYGRMGDGGSADYLEPRPVYFFEDNNLKAKQISAGQAFSLVLGDDGRCYTWGKNDQGQLGIGGSISMDVYAMENFPRAIDGLEGHEIAYISAGHAHAVALTTTGELFLWGMKNWMEPHKVESGGVSFKSVSCGRNFTAAVTDAGDVYTFGGGSLGPGIYQESTYCLGHAEVSPRQEPEKVQYFADQGRAVHKVVCADHHIATLSTSQRGADADFSLRE